MIGDNKNHHRYMFVVRKEPVRYRPGGGVEFWGFTGLNLPPNCPTKGYPDCPYSHDEPGRFAALGGHPDVNWGDSFWTLLDE